MVVELYAAAQHVRVPAELPLPEGVAENYLELTSRLILTRREETSQCRWNAQEWQNVRAYAQCPELFRTIRAGEIGRPEFGRAHVVEGAALRFPISKIRRRDRPASMVQNHDQTFRVAITQRTQQNRIDSREDRRIRADAKRQGDDRDCGESRIAAHSAQAVADIAPKLLQPDPGPHFACDLFHEAQVAELAASIRLGLGSGFPALHAVADGHAQMALDFFS